MSISSLPQRQPATERVAAEVRALMGRHNVTQMQLRDVLGVSQPAISARLHGQVPFDANEIEALAEYFDVSPGDLFGMQPVPGPRDGGSMTTHQYAHSRAA